MQHDTFTRKWYSTFLDSILPETTSSEVAFVEHYLPLDAFPNLIDIACGPGRHTELLAAKGYHVLGIDKDRPSIRQAQENAQPNASYRVLDMRDLATLPTKFDGAINLWHSFGFYDDATNGRILKAISQRLRRGGRAIFAIYNRNHMQTLPEEVESFQEDELLRTRRRWKGNRLTCEIRYRSGLSDTLNWQIYTPDEFADLADQNGLTELTRCAWFNADLSPSKEHARMQFVFERR